MACVIGAALSLAGYFIVLDQEHAASKAHFEHAIHKHVAILDQGLNISFSALRSLGGLFLAKEKVSPLDFKRFIEPVLDIHPEIQALEWIPRIKAPERAAFEAMARKEGFAGFQITERTEQGMVSAGTDREEYFPVYLVEPYEKNRAAHGFDLASSPTRLKALEMARDTGKMAATERITLVQETGDQYGFLIFQPVYRAGAPVDSVESRRANLMGFTLGVFRIDNIINNAIGSFSKLEQLSFHVFDHSAPAGKQLLYPKSSPIENRGDLGDSNCLDDRLDITGRDWLVTFCPPAGGVGYVVSHI